MSSRASAALRMAETKTEFISDRSILKPEPRNGEQRIKPRYQPPAGCPRFASKERTRTWGTVAPSGLGGIESLANGAVPGRVDALASQGGGRMQVADRNSERVGCVGRLGRLGKGQQAGHHRLDLLLPGFTVAHDRGLDGKRGVLCHLESCDSSGKHGDASDLPEFERRLHVQRVKNIFDCDLVRLMLANQLLETKIDSLKTGGHRFARREFDRAAG